MLAFRLRRPNNGRNIMPYFAGRATATEEHGGSAVNMGGICVPVLVSVRSCYSFRRLLFCLFCYSRQSAGSESHARSMPEVTATQRQQRQPQQVSSPQFAKSVSVRLDVADVEDTFA